MSRIYSKKGHSERKRKSDFADCMHQLTTSVLLLFLTLYFAVLPYYFSDKYEGISTSKTVFYRRIALYLKAGEKIRIPSILTVAAVLAICELILRYRLERMSYLQPGTEKTKTGFLKGLYGFMTWVRKEMKGLDAVALTYGCITMLSFLFSSYKREAELGFYGWNMGLYAQLSVTVLYFLCSRYLGTGSRKFVLGVASAAAAGIFITGILQRFRIDIYSFYELIYEEVPRWYSRVLGPIGHVDYLGSYMILLLPLGMWAFLYEKRGRTKAALTVYMLLGFLFTPVMGAESFWPALAAVFLLYLWFSFDSTERLRTWVLMVLLCLSMFLVMGILRSCLPGKYVMPTKELNLLLMNWKLLVPGIILLGAALAGIRRLEMMQDCADNGAGTGRSGNLHRLRRIVFSMIGTGAAVIGVYFILNSLDCLPEGLSAGGYLHFDNNWGTRRGGTWIITLNGWREMIFRHPLRFLVGSGPDTYYSAVYIPNKAVFESLQGKDVIFPTGMSEPLTVLCNQGILGLICFLGIPAFIFHRTPRLRKVNPAAVYYAAAILGYYVFGFLNFHAVTSTPGMFILAGMWQAVFLEGMSGKEQPAGPEKSKQARNTLRKALDKRSLIN